MLPIFLHHRHSNLYCQKHAPTTKVARPKIDTQEPTVGKTSLPKDDTKHMGMGADTQEPTFTTEVEPQELVLHPNDIRIEEHIEVDIIKETMTMLKNLANSVAMMLQVKILPALGALNHKVCHLDL